MNVEIPNNPKNIKAFITQLLVHRYYEQQNNRIVLMYGELINDIDVFTDDITNLFRGEKRIYEEKPVIGVFLEDIKTKGLDYAETLEIKNETPENFKIEHVQKLVSKCPYFENTKIKLVIVPVDYNFKQLDKLKRCQELKDKIVKKIQTEEEKENVINYIMHAKSKDSIFKILCDIVERFDVIKLKQYNKKVENYDIMYKNFLNIDFIV